MSKTTIALIITLLIALGVFLSLNYHNPSNAIITSLAHPNVTQSPEKDVTLSLTSSVPSVQMGQTFSITVHINSQAAKSALAQLELAYDPSVVTATTILPGIYFTKPTIPLQNIRLDSGRISYALRCPMQQGIMTSIDCANAATNNLATITFLVNAYTAKSKTTISFLPKTLVRSKDGTDILGKTTNITLAIHGARLPIVASSSAQAKPTP